MSPITLFCMTLLCITLFCITFIMYHVVLHYIVMYHAVLRHVVIVSRCSAPRYIGSCCSAIRCSFLLLIWITCSCITLLCHKMFCTTLFYTTWFFSWRTPVSRIYWALKAGSKPSPPLPEDEEAWATWLNAKWNRESASTNKTASLTYPGISFSVKNMLNKVFYFYFSRQQLCLNLAYKVKNRRVRLSILSHETWLFLVRVH